MTRVMLKCKNDKCQRDFYAGIETTEGHFPKLALFPSTFIQEGGPILWAVNSKNICPICKMKIVEHSKLQYKICRMITVKQFANNSPGFDTQFRPFFDD